jgi:molybdopterin-guanine dinucleotide biosynthesis protein A
MSETPPLAALVLAGGRASRLGGVDKPALELDGASLLARTVTAARAAGADPVIVVGPERPGLPVVWAREQPPFGGPVAALAAALPRLEAEWVLALAADLRRPGAVLDALREAPRGADGCLLADAGGQPQWLCGIYRSQALRAALSALGEPAGASLRQLLGGLRVLRHPAASDVVADVDTPADAREAGISL